MKYLTVLIFSLSFIRVFGQIHCTGGSQSGSPGGGVTPPGIGWPFPVLNSYDPNDIVPPATVGEQGWVRRDQELPFMLRCENHPDSATAPVQEAWFYLPFHANADASRFQFGDIGFGDFYISVPTGLQSFSKTVDASTSLGVKVVIEAGIESAQNRAYWHFLSLDPVTNLPPADPFVGFLPVNDSITHRGEAFAHFIIQPKATTQTFDLLATQASIIFDENPPIATPILINTIDANHPKSNINTSFSAPDNSHLRVKWSGTDVGCGVANYTIFVSTDSAAFVPWQVLTATTEALLPAVLGHHYRFVSVARDSVGNVEPVKAPTEVVFTEDLITVGTTVLEMDQYDIRVYPNPHTSYFNMSIRSLRNETVHFRLYDPVGKLVLTQTYPNQQGDVLIPIHSNALSAGIYWLEVWVGEHRGGVKVLKQ